MLLQQPQLATSLKDSFVFLDTNVFSIGSRSSSLLEFLTDLNNNKICTFVSIPSVFFELVRGSNSLSVYNENANFYREIVSSTHPTKTFEDQPEFSIVMAKTNASNKSYTDFLLAAALYNYRNSGKVFLLTTDIHAFPEFFEVHSIITATEDKSNEVRNLAFITFNLDKYALVAAKIIKDEDK